MELTAIKKVASAHVKSFGDNVTAGLFNKGLRTNLITLLCQEETVEVVGTVAVFGGTKDMTGNMSRAVFNLFCVAEVLGVDLATGIEKAITDAKEKLAVAESEATGEPAAPKLAEKPAETRKTATETSSADAKEMPADTEKNTDAEQTAGADTGVTGDGPKAKKIETYRIAFKDAKSPTDVRTVWNNVVQDKDLTGPDRFILQNAKKEAEKRVGK